MIKCSSFPKWVLLWVLSDRERMCCTILHKMFNGSCRGTLVKENYSVRKDSLFGNLERFSFQSTLEKPVLNNPSLSLRGIIRALFYTKNLQQDETQPYWNTARPSTPSRVNTHKSHFWYIFTSRSRGSVFVPWIVFSHHSHDVTYVSLSSRVQFQGLTCWNVLYTWSCMTQTITRELCVMFQQAMERYAGRYFHHFTILMSFLHPNHILSGLWPEEQISLFPDLRCVCDFVISIQLF